MSFVSYAQNFEDVMLWRALKDIKGGFYVDVGANSPGMDSVTKAFYDRGWRGINIEPLASHFLELQQMRPGDINIQCAAGPSRGEVELWECDVRGWASADETTVAFHKKHGHKGVFLTVPMLTLSEICATNAKGAIHFLKIDVEGFEKQVLDGMDFSTHRPWILLIEATRPNSTEEIYAEWESQVLNFDYIFAYSDGLNRFYVAKEHSELLTSFRYPPNVFDNFVRYEQALFEGRTQVAEDKIILLESQIRRTESLIQNAETEIQKMKLQIQESIELSNHLTAKIEGIYCSTSWRITKPLRVVKQLFSAPKNNQ
ncbi:MAG: FkbM family methyltransferase [Bdellovibrionaceae bacterium]|nr:FkbM family methyltransferase [Pseudobdellovibrionaceae bacterium]